LLSGTMSQIQLLVANMHLVNDKQTKQF
jgi:hypothetical protein